VVPRCDWSGHQTWWCSRVFRKWSLAAGLIFKAPTIVLRQSFIVILDGNRNRNDRGYFCCESQGFNNMFLTQAPSQNYAHLELLQFVSVQWRVIKILPVLNFREITVISLNVTSFVFVFSFNIFSQVNQETR
jgi:hypothetical protein